MYPKKYCKTGVLATCLFTLCLLACAQNQRQRIVTGKVTDAETGEPIPAASVYIAGTTVGTATGNEGLYELKLPGQGSYELVVSHVGYEPVIQKVEINRALIKSDFSLKIYEMEGVTITARARKVIPRPGDVAVFWSTLLGQYPSKTLYPLKIKEKDISFNYNTNTNILKVSCRVPIEIVNLETGYRITYTLMHFEHDYNAGYSFWKGMYLFKEIASRNKKKKNEWALNRELVYSSSKTRFFRSLYHGTLWDDGFMLYYHGRYINSSNERKVVPYYFSQTYTNPFVDSKEIVFPNNLDNDGSKLLYIPADSAVMLICFGGQITGEDKKRLKEAENTHVAFPEKDQICEHFDNVGLYRNYLSTPYPIKIFADGTYSDGLHLLTCYSRISGLNMYLPLEYGLNADSIPYSRQEAAKYITTDDLSPVYQMDSLMTRQSPEKIYLTTDRPYYAAGDTVWLNAWVLNAGTLEPTDKSRMLHVELIGPDGAILRHITLDASQGLAPGQLVLPPGITGDALFRIRAYTRWSLNFDESYRFEKTIPVVQFRDDVWQGPKKTENKNYEWVRRANGSWAWQRKEVTTDSLQATNGGQVADSLATPSRVTDLDLQFLPEGGRWVTGFPCRMAFKALASDGRGVNVEGDIIDDLGETVTTFRSLHRGMGSVFLAPQPGRRYHARLFSGHTVDLPLPDTAGIVMTVQPVRDDSLAMQLYFPPETVRRGESFHLVAQSRGVYAAAWEITAARTRIAMRLPVDQLQTGIARFTLFAGDGIPCNERLIFVDKEDEIRLRVRPLPPTPSPKGRGSVLSEGTGDVAPLSFGEGKGVRLLLHALDAVGLPVQGVFTVSVTDSLYGSHDTRDATLRSQMLLSSDLKGKVEDPGWYFQDRDSMRLQALDLVMQTHGWSGYSWEDIRNAGKTIMQYTPELDYRISGRVTNLRGAAAKDVSVTYLAQGAVTLSGDTVTDAQGRFGFDHLLPLENTVVSLIAKYRKGKRNALGLGIELNRQPQVPSPPVTALPRFGSSAAWEEQLAMYRMQKQSDEHWLDSLLKRTDTKMIKEVTIEAKRPVKGSYNLNGPGQADHVLYEEDIARYDKYDRLLDIFKIEFPQFQQESWQLDELLREINHVFSIDSYELKKIPFSYPVWRFSDRTLLFILNGRVLPAGLPAEDTLYLPPHPVTDSLKLIAINFWNIPATDITGIEILDSPEYLYAYQHDLIIKYYNEDLFRSYLRTKYQSSNLFYSEGDLWLKLKLENLNIPNPYIQTTTQKIESSTRPLLVEVTTRSGRTHIGRTPTIGLAKQSLRGFAIPRAFYVPKYYPDNMVDQAEYDVKPTLYWNPEVVTDREGKAEITFPVGLKPRSLQIRVEGTDLQGGIGSTVQGISVNEGNNHQQQP